MMKLGVVITDIRQSQLALETMQEALQRAWDVRCFLTEDGVNMVKNDAFIEMAGNAQTHFSMCEHSAERYCNDIDLDALGDVVIVGGQYQNAELVHNCDRVLVF
jgi:sulfur relay (sulfurtransferase) complex TusBCD TusD component (DsrE family)